MYNHDYTRICKIPASSHTFQIHRCCYLSYIRLCLKKKNAKGKPHVFAYHGVLNTPYASVLPPPHPLGFLNITDKSWNPNWWEVAIYRLLRTWRTKHKDVQWWVENWILDPIYMVCLSAITTLCYVKWLKTKIPILHYAPVFCYHHYYYFSWQMSMHQRGKSG